MTEEIDQDTDLVTVTWHKDTGWMIVCPFLGAKLDCLTLGEISNFLKAVDSFVREFEIKEGGE